MKTITPPIPHWPRIALPRVRPVSPCTNPLHGRVIWAPTKSLWFATHALIALTAGSLTFTAGAFAWFAASTALILCLGSVGMHRLLTHRSFACPKWVEYTLVHFGTVVGMGGPLAMLHMHDLRDWAQRHPQCHPFFANQGAWWRDFIWQNHGELRLDHPPAFVVEPEVARDPVYRWMQRTWMAQQLPWLLLSLSLGGVSWAIWGVSVRILVAMSGHCLVGYLVHNFGQRDWHLQGHAVQGFNLPRLSLVTMGESLHNNHHAFPSSAQFGLRRGQFDPGWWLIRALRAAGLAWDVTTPSRMPPRPERIALPVRSRLPKKRASVFFAS